MQLIDALVVTLGLNADNFKKGSKDAQTELEKTRKQSLKTAADAAEAFDKQATVALTKFKNEALAVTGVLLGATGIKDWLASTVKANVQTGNLAKGLGMTANELNAWRRAAAAAGGDADQAQSALESMSEALTTLKLSGKMTGPLEQFKALNISAVDAKGNVIGVVEALKRVAGSFQGHTAMDQAFMARQMGFGAGVLPLLSEGPAAIQARLAEMHKIGDITEGAYQSSKALNEEWIKLKASVEAAGAALEHKFEGPLLNILRGVGKIAEALKEADGFWSKMYQGITGKDNRIGGGVQRSWLTMQRVLVNKELGDDPNAPIVYGANQRINMLPSFGSAPTANLFTELEQRYKLPAGLLSAMFMKESGGGKYLRSPKGALGPFQFLPDTAREYGVTNPFDLHQSASGAAAMMADLLRKYGGNLPKALAGYNWGQGKLDKFGIGQAPSETRDYIATIMSRVGSPGAGQTVHNETNIGQITVQTQATDAKGIARDMRGAIAANPLVAQSNGGMR